MKNWETTIVNLDSTILDAVQAIDRGGKQVAVVVGNGRALEGLITDGDIRRAILQGIPLTEPVSRVMKKECVVASSELSSGQLLDLLRTRGVRLVPLIDQTRQVNGLAHIDDFLEISPTRSTPVVIMAGGLGTRLRPLTETLPKPMLPVGGRPMLEIVLQNFIAQGFTEFYISLFYLGHIIENYFGDGSSLGASITYLREKSPLGTAGALALLPENVQERVIITNGDVLTRLDVRALLDFHASQDNVATMCVREFTTQIPFGVVELLDNHVVKIEEKPYVQRLVNAGIYVLETSLLSRIPQNSYLDMPDFISSLLTEEKLVGAFPIREYWTDVGRFPDLEAANAEHHQPSPPPHHEDGHIE